ncbi:MAG: hypothetical protein EOM03_05365 [Clostridia bacterium]|nr:hypothetical protein [Clostridia bacterium]
MAKYQRSFTGDFDDTLRFCDATIAGGSVSASLEDMSNMQLGDVRVAVRVYERYSYLGGNRVSMNLTLAGSGRNLSIAVITSGGSQAMFFKINTFGEEAFLDTLASALDDYINGRR